MIDSDADTPQPQDMRNVPAPIIGYTLSGKPIKQGFDSLEIVYQILTYAKMAKLQSLYDPADPLVSVTFDDPVSGTAQTYTKAYMEPPQIGGRTTMYYMNVVVKFTHVTSS